MIRIWLWEEAPAELRGYPGLEDAARGEVPVWLAHAGRAGSEEGEAGVLRVLTRAWEGRRGRAAHAVEMGGGAGVLAAGCLTDDFVSEESAT